MVTYDGKTDDDRALWHTYLHWGRELLRPGATGAIVDDPGNRLTEPESDLLQAIVFSAFALEFRIKRVLTFNNASLKPDEGLRDLLKDAWVRLAGKPRRDGNGLITKPDEWDSLYPTLMELATARNDIAHANRREVLRLARASAEQPLIRARRYFNSVVDAIRVLNQGTGYDTRPNEELHGYFDLVKV